MDLEPAFAADHIGGDEFFVRFDEIQDPFDQADDTRCATSDECRDELDNSFFGLTPIELMDTERTKKDAK